MIIQVKKIIGLPVLTKSGERLGRVIDCLIDLDSQSIIQYLVRRGPFGRGLLIHRGQVISIDARKVIVEDAVMLGAVNKDKIIAPAVPSAAPNLMSHDQP